jgi:hypothetical protein
MWFVPGSKHIVWVINNTQLMLYTEVISAWGILAKRTFILSGMWKLCVEVMTGLLFKDECSVFPRNSLPTLPHCVVSIQIVHDMKHYHSENLSHSAYWIQLLVSCANCVVFNMLAHLCATKIWNRWLVMVYSKHSLQVHHPRCVYVY